MRADCCIPEDELWHAHMEGKHALVRHVSSAVGNELDPRLPIVGFARRMTAYKRPDLLFSDLGHRPAQPVTRTGVTKHATRNVDVRGKSAPNGNGVRRCVVLIIETSP